MEPAARNAPLRNARLQQFLCTTRWLTRTISSSTVPSAFKKRMAFSRRIESSCEKTVTRYTLLFFRYRLRRITISASILNPFFNNVKHFLATATFSVCILTEYRSVPEINTSPHMLIIAASSAIWQWRAVEHCRDNSSFTSLEKDIPHLYILFVMASLPISRCSILSPYSSLVASRQYSSLASATDRCFPPVHPTAITS